ncbi:MAG: ABC transporter ATP-binding protein [Sphingobacteriia bacterium]|nr:ABC transporter ATP-binding protein [Sphingobacteriia bacterium]
MTKTAIEISNLTKSIDGKVILNNINLNIITNKITALIGLNGVGKTTLIKSILGLLNLENGYIKVFDKSLPDEASRNKVAFLPEKFSPSSFLKGKEFLKIALSFYKKEDNIKLADKYLGLLNLPEDILNSAVNKYSKGMSQKLGLLFIILSECPIWILDEPMSGLDALSRQEVINIMIEHRAKGGTIFFTSHLIQGLEKICDQIAVMDKGKIIFSSSPSELNSLYNTQNLETDFLKLLGYA